MTTELIPVADDNPYPLGRAGVHHDPRNRLFRALAVPPPRALVPNTLWWSRDVYDQGSESSCTAQAAVGLLRTGVHYRRGFTDWSRFDDPDERHRLYRRAQTVDPWEGDYEGTSTDAPFKILAADGVISAWRWLFGEPELREWLTWYGPAVVGTIWTDGMFTPDRNGYIVPTGVTAGGHAYRLAQYSQRRDAYRVVNSWGRGWGQSGRAWIRSVDMADLLAQQGEAVTV